MKRFIFGAFVFWGGLIFLAFSFMYAIMNPAIYNGIDGFIGSLKYHDLIIPFIISLGATLVGIGICGYEAYGKEQLDMKATKMIDRMNEMNKAVREKIYK